MAFPKVLEGSGCSIEAVFVEGRSQWCAVGMQIEPRLRRSQEGHQETFAFSLLLLSNILPEAPVGLTLQKMKGHRWCNPQGQSSLGHTAKWKRAKNGWGGWLRSKWRITNPHLQCVFFLVWLLWGHLTKAGKASLSSCSQALCSKLLMVVLWGDEFSNRSL